MRKAIALFIVLLAAVPARAVSILDGLQFCLTLDNTYNDAHGSNHFNGIATPTFINAGVAGYTKCLALNGTNQCARINDSAANSPTGEMTIIIPVIPLGVSGTQAVIAKDDFGVPSRAYSILLNGASNRWQAEQFSGSTGTTVTANNFGALQPYVLQMLCFRRAANGTISLSVNAGTPDSVAGTGATNDTAIELSIGSRMNNGSRTSAFNGIVKGPVLFWNRCLTLAEISWVYNGGQLRRYDELVGYKSLVDPNVTAFKALKDQATCHFGTLSYQSAEFYELGVPADVPASLFDPTGYDHWESYFDQCEKLGIRAVWLTAKHWSGFALWPSRTNSYNVADTPFYARTGVDVFKDFCRAARLRGLTVNLYYCVACKWYETEYSGPLSYEQYTLAMLTELMGGEYGQFGYVLLDGWGPFWDGGLGGVGFGAVGYSAVYNRCKALQPNCLVAVNNHDADALTVYGDIRLFEVPVEDVTPANYYVFPGATSHQANDRLWTDNTVRWFRHSNSLLNRPVDAKLPIGRRYLDRKRGAVTTYNWGLDPLGILPADTRTMNDEIWQRPMTTVLSDTLAEASSTTLQAHNANWSKVGGGQNIIIDPTAEAWPNNDYISYDRTDSSTVGDFYQEATFRFRTVADFQVFLKGQATSSTNDVRFYWTRSGGTITCELARNNSGLTNLDSYAWSTAILANTDYKVTLSKTGNELRGEVFEKIDGEWISVGKAMATNSATNSGLMGIAMSSNSSSTTGIRMTSWRTGTPDTTAPAAPTLAYEDQTLIVTKPADADHVKVQRSANNGRSWIPVAYLRSTAFTSNVARFKDTEVADVRQYRYRAICGDTSFNESSYRMIGGVGTRDAVTPVLVK